MRIQVSPEYHWLFGCVLLVVPSGAAYLGERWWDACRFVWWWPVNWAVYPFVLLSRAYLKIKGATQ